MYPSVCVGLYCTVIHIRSVYSCKEIYLHPLQRIEEEATHLFPFMLPGAKGSLAQVYCRVKQLMTAIISVTENRRAKKRKALVDGLREIVRSVD